MALDNVSRLFHQKNKKMRTAGAVSGFNSFYMVLLDHIDRARDNPSVHAAHGNCERNWEIL